MASFLQKWFGPPFFEGDDEKTRKARLLNIILLSLFLMASLYLVFAPIEPSLWPRRLVIIAPFLVVVGALWWAMRRGFVRFTGEVVVFALWAMFTLAIGYGAGYNNPAYMGYVIVVVCASLLLGQRATIVWAGVSILTSFLIVRAAEQGFLSSSANPLSGSTFWVAQTMYILVIAVLLSLALRSIEEAMSQAKQELAERRRAEEALRASEGRLQMVLDNLGEGICVQDNTWHYTYANPAAHMILGLPLGALIGMSEDDVLKPSDIPMVKDQNVHRKMGHITSYENDILRPNGEMRTVLTTGVPRLDEQGTLIETFVAFTDITERKRLEQELQEERDFVLQIINTMGQGLTVTDEKGFFILVNPAFLKMTGYELDDLMGNHISTITAFEDEKILTQATADRLSGKVTSYEHRLRQKDGNYLTAFVTGAPRTRDGKYAGSIAVVADLTEIKRNEEALRTAATELEERNASLQIVNEVAFKLHRSRSLKQIAEEAVLSLKTYSQSPMIAFYLLNKSGDSLTLLAQTGFDVHTVQLGTSLPLEGSLSGLTVKTQTIVTSEDLEHDERAVQAVREVLARQGLSSAISIPLLFQQEVMGVINLVFREMYRLNDSQRETLLAIGNTVGLAIANANHLAQAEAEALERRRAEAEVRQLNAELEHRVTVRTVQLEEANQELESFAYSVSHDLRTPLRAIEGFVNILMELKMERLDAEAQQYLTRVSDNGKRMSQLIDDLLTFSRLGRKPIQKQKIEPELVVKDILYDLEAEIGTRQVQIDVAHDFPVCEGDPTLIRLVFVNLLENALKYSRPRPIAKVEIGWLEQAGEVIYFVRDNGVGFDMAYADKLFGVFQRLHRQDEFEGTGVGLANVYRILRRHGGRIWVEAAVDQGATFYFTVG